MEKLYKEQPQATPFFEEHPEDKAYNPGITQFPEFNELRSYKAKRAYVEERMIQLIDSDELRLTDTLCNWSDLRDVVGDVILGLTYVNDSQEPCPVPFEIQNAKIKVESATGKEIKWYDGQRSNRKLSPNPKIDQYMQKIGRSVVEKRNYRTGSEEAYLPLRQAWKILKQNGLHIKWSETKLNKELQRPLEQRRQIVREVNGSQGEDVRDKGTEKEASKVRGRGRSATKH